MEEKLFKQIEPDWNKAIEAGCEIMEHPKERDGDPDRRATFKDFGGNIWSLGTQL